MAAIVGYGGSVRVVIGAPVALTNEPTTADASRTIYTITALARRALDPYTNIVVETSPNGSSWSAANGYTIAHPAGQVRFAAAQPVGTQIRIASGSYLPTATAGNFREWALDAQRGVKDTTILGQAWEGVTPLQASASAKLSGFWVDGYWLARLADTAPMALWLNVDEAGARRYCLYAWPTKNGVKVDPGDVVTEEVEATADGPVYYVEA